jgi:hypothetical protein
VTLVIIAVAAAITAGIIIWKNWDKVIEIVKKGVALFVRGFVEYIKMFAKAASAIAGFIPGLDGLKKKIDEGIGKLDNMADGMEDWADTGQRSFSDVGEAASDSERKIAMAAIAAQEDMGGMGAASETMATAIKTNNDKVQTSFKTTGEVVTASAKGWGFEVDKATGITEEMAVRTATATRNIAAAFQAAGDESMTIPAALCAPVIPKPVIPTIPVIPRAASDVATTIAQTWAEAATKATKDLPGGGFVSPGVVPGEKQNIQDWVKDMDAALAAAGLTGFEKFQGGGVSMGGMALVGERGPEIVSLPGGARVHPSGTGPGGVVNQFHFHGAVYGVEDLKEAVVEAVRDHAISGGFSGVFAEA